MYVRGLIADSVWNENGVVPTLKLTEFVHDPRPIRDSKNTSELRDLWSCAPLVLQCKEQGALDMRHLAYVSTCVQHIHTQINTSCIGLNSVTNQILPRSNCFVVCVSMICLIHKSYNSLIDFCQTLARLVLRVHIFSSWFLIQLHLMTLLIWLFLPSSQ